MSPPLDLYRVGVPSIGEAWPKRFNYRRSTGGLGTGVYAFRDREPAKTNISRSSPDSELYVLQNALEFPIQPRTRDATDALVRLSRMMDLLRVQNDIGEYTYGDAREGVQTAVRVSLTSGITGDRGWGEDGQFVTSVAREVLFNTPELRDRYGYEEEAFVLDFIDATEEAEARLDTADGAGIQPINVLLYPEFDGVAPLDGAGGNTGTHGCVVFKQRVDKCVGHATDSFEEVPADVLNACWAD